MVKPNLSKTSKQAKVFGEDMQIWWRRSCSLNSGREGHAPSAMVERGEGHAPSAMADRVMLSNLRGETATALQNLMDMGHELSLI